ncbi:MAG TPA: GTPase HflX [Candidatus Bathyarchaeota archaeon]|nr:GTPase HflX [Candidatus Bathyarchaeota archaeon]
MCSMQKAWLCLLRTDPHDHKLYKIYLEELRSLVGAAGYTVIGETIQTRRKPHVSLLFGRGKLEELKEVKRQNDVDVFVFFNILSTIQYYNLSSILGNVIDRYDLTLQIFEEMSMDRVSKLQIELARLRKHIPIIKLLESIRFKSGREHPGPRSLGEYAYHRKLVNLVRRRKKIERELQRYRRMHSLHRRKRRKLGIPTVCLTGYYNAGKTTLFNLLTGQEKPVSPRPFTTLSSKYSKVQGLDVFLIDTIGFMTGLDPQLIESFSITLEDIKESDLVLNVIDIAENNIELLKLRYREVVNQLKRLGIEEHRIVYVLNKIDLLSDIDLEYRVKYLNLENESYVPISAKRGENISLLTEAVARKLANK